MGAQTHTRRIRTIIIFVAIAVGWIVLDFFTKRYFDSGQFDYGSIISQPIPGFIDFRLIHNVGGAWGLGGNATIGLGIFSLVICALIVAYLFVFNKNAHLVQYISLAFVFAGGIGNAIDRFFVGYVTDFIEFSFFDFPVFNIADIGVTCGIIVFVIALLVETFATGHRTPKASSQTGKE